MMKLVTIVWAVLQVGGGDAMPRVTLPEALRLATPLDPVYVDASGRVDAAAWQRTSAWSTFVLPSLTASSSITKYSEDFFNIADPANPTKTIVNGLIEARYDLFTGGTKFFELGRASAALAAAKASELEARFRAELETESNYYDVIAQQELLRVAQERVRRAEEQFAVARARVLSGAEVQTDSLQQLLELTRARVGLLLQQSALRVARLNLGRRVGIAGPVDAVPLEALPAPELPLAEEEAVAEALEHGPRYRAARASERAADAAVKAARGSFLPTVTLFGQWLGYDVQFFPDAETWATYGINVSFPIWNRGQREVALVRARADRDAARARASDAERAVRQEITDAYDTYTTARASAELAAVAVAVSQENLRVQSERYRAGATTIIDLITAQVAVAEADAGLVQARQATRLALARLESLLGRRLFPLPGAPQ